jgi:hypothetical protein
MEKFFALQKFDERTGVIYGVMTAEEPDKSGEIFDYGNGGKAAVQAWSDDFVRRTRAAGQAVSMGCIRLMHRADTIAGKAIQIDYDDDAKTIGLLSELTDEVRPLAENGNITGYSIAGAYESRNCNECGFDMRGEGNVCPRCDRRVLVRFVPKIVECSVVDNPCVPSATFQYIKADGSSFLKNFEGTKTMNLQEHLREHLHKTAEHHKSLAKRYSARAKNGSTLAKAAEARADVLSQRAHQSDSDVDTAIANDHNKRVAELSAMANPGHDIWQLSEWVGNPEAINDKVAKGDDWFSKYLYGGAPENMVTLPSVDRLFE